MAASLSLLKWAFSDPLRLLEQRLMKRHTHEVIPNEDVPDPGDLNLHSVLAPRHVCHRSEHPLDCTLYAVLGLLGVSGNLRVVDYRLLYAPRSLELVGSQLT